MKNLEIKTDGKTIKILLIIFIILLALPSIIYMVTGNSIIDYECNYNYFLKLNVSPIYDGIIFFAIFTIISILYILILKDYKKIFKSNKELVLYVIIIAVLFTIILPMTSTDVFYYISTGWSEAKYKINPYYTSVQELVDENNIFNDEILNKIPSVWSNQKIVYGPLWTLISRILSFLSFGSLPIALIVFKLFNLIIHLINCKLIYKISNNKTMTLIYALNPLVLFESLTNVHNDISLIFFILLAFYFAIKRKSILLSVIALALATSIKYVAILIAPFLVIYFYKNQKVSKRIINAIWLAIVFLIVLSGVYLIYTKDFQVLQGIVTQQGKLAKSIFLILYLKVSPDIAAKLSTIFMIIFVIFYLVQMFIYLFKKNISLTKNLRITYAIMLAFLLLVITNFQTWYIMWLMPLIMFQKGKAIKSTINLTIASELSCTVFFIFGEGYTYGPFFWCSMIILWFIFNIMNKMRRNVWKK